MTVPELTAESDHRSLKPFDRKSMGLSAVSAPVVFVIKVFVGTLKASRVESINRQLPTAELVLIITHRGLKPQNINGPSALLLPV